MRHIGLISPRLILKPLENQSELEMILAQTRKTGPQNLRFRNPNFQRSRQVAMEGLGVSSGEISPILDKNLKIKEGKLMVMNNAKIKFKDPYDPQV